MKVGSDQTIVRDNNLFIILNHLKEAHYSSSELAEKLTLSKPALTKIINEMSENNLILISDSVDEKPSLGRKKVYYKINKSAGLIGIINFVSTYVVIALVDLEQNILESYKIEDKEFINKETLEEINSKLLEFKNLYERNDQKLLSICIAAPGQINKYTQEIYNSPRFKDCQGINIKEYFSSKLGVNVLLKNDINLSILGEKERGLLKESFEDAILIYIDSGIGGAVLSDNKILEGEHGFAGEFGLIRTFDKFGNVVYYDSLCSTNSIKNQIKYYKSIGEYTILGDKFRLADVVHAFYENDYLSRNVVLESAKHIGMLVSNLHNIFDIKNIYISGRIKLFGDEYLKVVMNNLEPLKDQVKIQYTKLGDESVMIGAYYESLYDAFKILIENRKKNNGVKTPNE